jgi:hypothetical protein
MTRRGTKLAIVLVAAGLPLAVVACSSSSKTTATTTTTTTTAANKSFEVTTADGQASLSLDGQLPPGWPQAFPIPAGATAAGSGSLSNETSGGSVAVFTTTATPQDTYSFYRDSKTLTVTSSSALGAGETYLGTVKLGGSYPGSVSVLARTGQTYIVIVLDAGSGDSSSGSSSTSSSYVSSTTSTVTP